jgi:asparagine synthase (glutamine-hydrolysing)
MCGISGFFGSVTQEALERSSELIAHRGPDGTGLWFDQMGAVGLAHRRLAILDLSPAGAQPMLSNDGALVLVFNGEIYNFPELRSDLIGTGHQFRGHSDTEVLLALYAREGLDMLKKLNGIFAFALYDKRQNELILARDALGVKPLYFSSGVKGFVFSSEIKGLLPLLEGSREINPIAIHRYLSFQWCPGNLTPLKAVRKLGPGEAMIVRERRIERQWTWYDLPYCRDMAAKKVDSTTIVSDTRDIVRDAVNRQLISDVPVGAFLSGGLDSSAVVAFAREQVPDIQCFTIETTGGRDAGVADDLPYARRVATHLGVQLHVVKVESHQFVDDIERMVYMLDEPLADPAALNAFYISQLARQNGIKVLLSGAGGDDIFTGYWRHLALHYERIWAWWPEPIRRAIAKTISCLDQRNPLGRRLNRLFAQAGENSPTRMVGYFASTRESSLSSLYTQNFLAELGQTRADQEMLDFLADMSAEATSLDQILALEQHYYLADHNLMYTDKMSMAAGVEVRVPFLDLDLVEFAAQVPDRYKLHGREAKWILKKAMEKHLPHEVIYRPKTGFGVPLRRWMRHELRELLGDLLSPASLKRRNIFDPIAVQRLIDDNDSGRVDGANTLLALLCVEIWLRQFIDGSA